MAVICQWDPRYSVHDATVDADHQELFRLANQVFTIVDPMRNAQSFKEAIKALYQYMEYHFQHEEELMERVGFPGIAEHRARHRQIVATVNDILRKSKNLRELATTLKHIMLDWVLKHIVEEDSKIVASIPQTKAKLAAAAQ